MHRARQLLRSWGGLLVAIAVLLGPWHSGARYFYCESCGLLPYEPCGETAHVADRGGPSVQPESFDCCESFSVPTVPEGSRVPETSVPPAPVALLPVVQTRACTRSGGGARGPAFADRWLRPPRPGGGVRAASMVSLT